MLKRINETGNQSCKDFNIFVLLRAIQKCTVLLIKAYITHRDYA